MSSEIYEFEGCFFNDPFSPFNDSSSPIDIHQALQEHTYNYTSMIPQVSSSPPLTTQDNNIDTPFDEIDQIAPTIHSSSPPSNQLENLSLHNQMGISGTSSNETFCTNLEVKTEESQQLLYDSNFYYGGSYNPLKMMQRCYSFQQKKSNDSFYQPKFDGLLESQILHSEVITSSPDHSFSSTYMRRACSTGDLQSPMVNQTSQRFSTSPLATESTSFMEEVNFKVGRYNAEERKEKIQKYRAKRTQRNFNKTIKYACRKTLADNRPRIRGRFARNDEPGELPKNTTFHRNMDDGELWIDGFHEDGNDGIIQRGQYFNTYSSIGQFHQFSFIQD
ncbi:uncharacterized protein [Rutidosis leptorrhynchoides]|uniref:uncharacterized protein n=1 Tax=Rutidosis leptorrhynchoides TaxID=125765 RepID=UPI003A990A4B